MIVTNVMVRVLILYNVVCLHLLNVSVQFSRV